MLWKVGIVFMLVALLLLVLGVGMVVDKMAYYLDFEFGGEVWGVGVFWAFDWVSVLFYFVVMLISGLIMVYSVDYMEGEENLDRFVYLMVGFVLSMGLVVFSCNLVLLLFGWDGLGLVSYCLVIYYQNNKSFNAGMITILSNRVGDVGMLAAIGMVFGTGGLIYVVGWEWMGLVVLLLIMAGMTKSAQIPFSAWLPAAMAAPTPVSSLVHSSTLVAAGVYLMIRLKGGSGFGSEVLFLAGVVTMMMAGLGAGCEMDLKKVVALSTLSQLGVMMMIVSLGEWEMAYFHMVVHALFSAMMFMCVGFVIHGMSGWQDVRVMGGLGDYCPLIGVSLMVSGLALMGFPFMAGFYSSDLILESIMMWKWGNFIMMMIVLSFVFTVIYSMKIFGVVLWGNGKVKENYMSWGESWNMVIAVMGLVFMTIVSGAVVGWLLFPVEEMLVLGWEKMTGLVVVVLGIWGSVLWLGVYKGWGIMGSFFGGMWFIWFLSGNPVVKVMEVCSEVSKGDELWGEMIGGGGLKEMIWGVSKWVELGQSADLKGLMVVCFLLVVVGILVYW